MAGTALHTLGQTRSALNQKVKKFLAIRKDGEELFNG